ncbi:MAG: hypothetical protein E7559_00145 [Ruminococcaceae bacterium]|nr:hypothetical protein [Oscillospiraceae bacterium]
MEKNTVRTPLLSSITARCAKRIKRLYTDNDLLPNSPLAQACLAVFVAIDSTSLYHYYALFNTGIFTVILRCIAGAALLNLPASIACTSVVNARAGITNGTKVKRRVIAAVLSFMLVFFPYASVTMLKAFDEGVLYKAEEEYTDHESVYGIIPAINVSNETSMIEQEEEPTGVDPIELFAAIGLAFFPLCTTLLSMFVSLACTKPLQERRRKLLTLQKENADDVAQIEQILVVQNACHGKLEGIRAADKAAAEHQRALILAEGERLKQEARMYISRSSKNPSEVSNVLAALGLTTN